MVSTISHSSHPDHQLIRTRLQRSVTCSICGEGGVTSCYHCKLCKFSIHVSCAGVSRGGDPRLKGAQVEIPGCERPGQFGKPEKTNIEEVEVPGGRGTGSSRCSEERRPKSSRGGANVGMPKLGHSGRIGVQGTMGAGAMGVSGQGVPTTKKGVVGAGMLPVGVFSGAAILSQVATLAVTPGGRGLVTKAITAGGRGLASITSGIGGPGMDETEEKGEEEGDEEEEEVEDNDYDGQDDDEEEEQSLEVMKEREIGAGIEEEDEEYDEEVEEEEGEEEEEEEEEEVEVEEEEEEEEEEEDDVVAIDSETEDIVPAKGFFAGMAGMAARAVTSAVVGEDADI